MYWLMEPFKVLGEMVEHEELDRQEHAPQIAIIGAGIGGLACAQKLMAKGARISCFEKSSRPGGRAATRISQSQYQFDHGAQYFTCRDPRFQTWVDSLLEANQVAVWQGKIVAIDEPSTMRELDSVTRYVGIPRMNGIGQWLARGIAIQYDCKVGKVTTETGRHAGHIIHDETGKSLGRFDAVLWNCPPKQVEATLPNACDWSSRLKEVVMLPCWAVMVAQASRWEVACDAAFINQGKLSWLARDTSKPGRDAYRDHWVLHSTTDWAHAHLESEADQVIETLTLEAERMLGLPMPKHPQCWAHRWLYSRPQASLPENALWDCERRLGACGDWCGESRVEGAYVSGLSLADRVLADLHLT